jgi:hypothetical protein
MERGLAEPCVEVVGVAGASAADGAAGGAAVDDDEAALLVAQVDGRHRGATSRRTVARMHIGVQRPETVRAMIRVTVAFNIATAVKADKVLACAREAPRQKSTSLRRTERGAPG